MSFMDSDGNADAINFDFVSADDQALNFLPGRATAPRVIVNLQI
jgi:hypothetical protein